MDYRQYYHLEAYLFGTVTQRFHERGFLNAFDLFSIVVWKSNRSKSYFARRLIGQSGTENLEEAARQLTKGIAHERGPKERLQYLLGSSWGLLLPTASAILTVLYPEEFTMYDERVCEQLEKLRPGRQQSPIYRECDDFHKLKNRTKDDLWRGYEAFICAVKQAAPNGLSLRDKDRYLVGKSDRERLDSDIISRFDLTESDLQ